MINEAIPFYRPGQDVTCKAAVALTGKRLCQISANRTGGPALSTDLLNVYVVNKPSAGGGVFGVVGYDVAINGLVPVKRDGILPVVTSGALTFDQEAKTDANGEILLATTGTVAVGRVLTGVGSAAVAELLFYQTRKNIP